MVLSKARRLMLRNQYRILSLLEPDDTTHREMAKALDAGFSKRYLSELEDLAEEIPDKVCDEVLEIFEMYRALERFKQQNPSSEIDHLRCRFWGFEASPDELAHLRCAIYLNLSAPFPYWSAKELFMETDGSHRKLIALNPKLDGYREMLKIWRIKRFGKSELTSTQVMELFRQNELNVDETLDTLGQEPNEDLTIDRVRELLAVAPEPV